MTFRGRGTPRMKGDQFKATVTRVMGPDIFEANIDLGFDLSLLKRFKLSGVDWSHMERMDSNERGKASEFLRGRIEGQQVILRVVRKGEHYYARVYYGPEERDVFNEMSDQGLLRRFDS